MIAEDGWLYVAAIALLFYSGWASGYWADRIAAEGAR